MASTTIMMNCRRNWMIMMRKGKATGRERCGARTKASV